ncbi:TniQ family protein [Photobacterium sp. J15]|uniref:TniQ family protein n=1 Tax=Photobacterium sp. J15 TaxID=265901 RepID=UPI0007E4D4E2|nr:TniQ family protein [Photobacterium sp. J15]
MSKLKLPYSLTPEDNECVQGFIARLAASNCCMNSSEVLSACDVKPNHHANFRQTGSYKYVMNVLQALSDESIQPAINHFEKQATETKLSPLLKSVARYCPACLAHSRIQNIDWQISLKTHCAKHGIQLIDKCPSCNESLSFEAINDDSCSYCSCQLSEFRDTVGCLPPYLNGLINLRGKALKDASKSLLDTAGQLLRPYDQLPGKSEYLENYTIPDLVEILTATYELLTKPAARKQYALEIEQARKDMEVISRDAMQYPSIIIDTSTISADNSPCLTPTFTKWQATNAVKNKVRQAFKLQGQEINDESTRFIGDLWGVERILGSTFEELSSLIKEKVIIPFKSAKSISGMLFDLRDFAKLLAVFPLADRDAEHYLSLESIRDNLLFEKCGSSLGELLKDQRIQTYRTSVNHGFHSLCWRKSDLESWSSRMLSQKEFYMTAKIVKLLLGINQTELNTLVAKGNIRRCKTNPHINKAFFHSYNSQDVQKLLNSTPSK